MNKKIKKYNDEMERNKLRIAELTARNKELRSLIKKEEDLEIIGTIRAMNMSVEDLIRLLHGDSESEDSDESFIPNTDKGENE